MTAPPIPRNPVVEWRQHALLRSSLAPEIERLAHRVNVPAQ